MCIIGTGELSRTGWNPLFVPLPNYAVWFEVMCSKKITLCFSKNVLLIKDEFSDNLSVVILKYVGHIGELGIFIVWANNVNVTL